VPAKSREPSEARRTSRRCIAIIADVVRSRQIHGAARTDLQRDLKGALQQLNERHAPAIVSKFVVTTGDEFQGLLCTGTAIPDIIWVTGGRHWGVRIRFGIGCGRLDTQVEPYAIGMDGPVWHLAREALQVARAKARLGGVFRGFGDRNDVILNGLAALLEHTRQGLTDRQFAIFEALRRTPHQTSVAETLGISRQAISKQARSTGWEAYRQGENAWRLMLQQFDYCRLWKK
jgi:hypothetical protein